MLSTAPPILPHPGPIHYGSLRLPSRYLLSPLAGYTNLSFRRVCRELGGVGLGTTDLVSARALMQRSWKSLQLIETCPEDRPFSVQIFGGDPGLMKDAAQYLEEYGVDSIDINMGCPVARITASGGGSAMMCKANETNHLVQTVVEAVRVPVTVKMRLGWDETQITAPQFAREFEQIGVAAIAIHGRTRAQGFTGQVSLDGIRQVVEAVQRIPVVGNGDIRTIADAARMFEVTGCPAISIGRGALANPWIFRQLVEWEATGQCSPPGSFDDRLQLLRRQFAYFEEQQGTDRGIRLFRKMAHWYLKAMRVSSDLRNEYQAAITPEEMETALQRIAEAGPKGMSRDGLLPDLHVPVPSGPVENW